jgi:hypothetical protein
MNNKTVEEIITMVHYHSKILKEVKETTKLNNNNNNNNTIMNL